MFAVVEWSRVRRISQNRAWEIRRMQEKTYQVVDRFVNGFHRVDINGVRGHDGTKMKELACENEL